MRKWTEPKNLDEVRTMLCAAATDVGNDRAMCPQVNEISNALGKVVNACKVKMIYSQLRKEAPNDPFIAS